MVILIFYNIFFAHELHRQLRTQLLNLTTTPEMFLFCDDVIICDVGLLLLIMINTMLFSVDDKN